MPQMKMQEAKERFHTRFSVDLANAVAW
jgi:hypothetical protein